MGRTHMPFRGPAVAPRGRTPRLIVPWFRHQGFPLCSVSYSIFLRPCTAASPFAMSRGFALAALLMNLVTESVLCLKIVFLWHWLLDLG